MPSPQKLIIKLSPIVFFKWLVGVEFGLALLGIILYLSVDLPQAYDNLQLARIASYTLIMSGLLAVIQVVAIAAAFAIWYFDSYEIDQKEIVRRWGASPQARLIIPTPTILEVRVAQSKLGHTLNYGTLELSPLGGGSKRRLTNIPNPYHYADKIKQWVMPEPLEVSRYLQRPLAELVAEGEGQYLEFKSSFSWDYRKQVTNKDLYKATLKNVVAFMNSTGGILLLGIDDDGQTLGLEPEFQSLRKANRDGFENVFNMAFNKMVGVEFRPYLTLDFIEVGAKTVCRLVVLPSPQPVFLISDREEEFYLRTGNSSQPLSLSQAIRYIQTHFSGG